MSSNGERIVILNFIDNYSTSTSVEFLYKDIINEGLKELVLVTNKVLMRLLISTFKYIILWQSD